MTVKVKQLEWDDDWAHTPFGLWYRIAVFGDAMICVLEKIEGATTTRSVHQSWDDAKTAAQGDYETRILSSLEQS